MENTRAQQKQKYIFTSRGINNVTINNNTAHSVDWCSPGIHTASGVTFSSTVPFVVYDLNARHSLVCSFIIRAHSRSRSHHWSHQRIFLSRFQNGSNFVCGAEFVVLNSCMWCWIPHYISGITFYFLKLKYDNEMVASVWRQSIPFIVRHSISLLVHSHRQL